MGLKKGKKIAWLYGNKYLYVTEREMLTEKLRVWMSSMLLHVPRKTE